MMTTETITDHLDELNLDNLEKYFTESLGDANLSAKLNAFWAYCKSTNSHEYFVQFADLKDPPLHKTEET
jgi:hypothetical protein